ncbi:hypothetical protein PBI_KAMPE_111 [Gordonia phage Kampe]|uniref:Uncharacterized protein n=3 Tax=Gordonia phage Orchid TaxID=1838075 RepID=A0A160DHH7_9CAUD|nr:hypothetical protein BH761_gp103 [Gordonia phage Orchid]ANA87343.1 hypothetical protein PBI_PATRICKSTAR_111 [Gordonia phage PatrickStar]ANA87454.1 hypothetical protein PBI_ORCHID_110 [Gordonia phage Orchid]ANA87569.1 hypothetical protein PBI_KAMPE_111 [Gordonia phage Kampe]AXH46565.1 hypothetical protein SEA_ROBINSPARKLES_120 [Gordonia phage RobinSparkles]
MKICAHINLSPYDHDHKRFDSVNEAKQYLYDAYHRHGLVDEGSKYYPNDYEQYHTACIDYYPQCDECDSAMNFHDYPMGRIVIGARGGIKNVSV